MITAKKPKLPKEWSYVLQAATLQGALDEARFEGQVDLEYSEELDSSRILHAIYRMPDESTPHARLQVSTGMVPSGERRTALYKLEMTLLPVFVDWLSRLRALPKESPQWQAKSREGKLYFHGMYVKSRKLRGGKIRKGMVGYGHSFFCINLDDLPDGAGAPEGDGVDARRDETDAGSESPDHVNNKKIRGAGGGPG